MREGWEKKPLLDVAQVVMGQSPPGTSYNLTGDGLPFIQGSAEFGERHPAPVKWCTDPRKIAEPGDLLLSVRAPVGDLNVASKRIAVGRGLSIIRGHDELASTSYLGHALAFGTHELAKRSSTGMFSSITGAQLKSLPVALPPLHEQKRIVDLMDSVDAAISAAQAEVNAAVELRGDLFDGLLQQFVDELEVRTLGDLGEFIRGRRFTKSDYVKDGLGCIHYGQVHTHFGLTANQPVTFVPIEMKGQLRFATTGDVVIAATSEDIDALGKATVWLGAEDVAVHDDCQIFRHDLDPLFATHLIASHGFHRQKVQYAAGTKVTRISGPNLAKITVQVPQRSRQEEIGRTMVSLDAVAEKAQSALDCLRNLRSSMLSALLSGEHEIPETYDQFLDLSEVVQAG